jgi:hypothetical protein
VFVGGNESKHQDYWSDHLTCLRLNSFYHSQLDSIVDLRTLLYCSQINVSCLLGKTLVARPPHLKSSVSFDSRLCVVLHVVTLIFAANLLLQSNFARASTTPSILDLLLLTYYPLSLSLQYIISICICFNSLVSYIQYVTSQQPSQTFDARISDLEYDSLHPKILSS